MSSGRHDATQSGATETLLVCAKCGHENPRGNQKCRKCDAHLYIVCKQCGQLNERVARACTACGKRLHATAWRQFRKKWIKRYSLVQVLVLIVTLAVLFKVTTMIIDALSKPTELPMVEEDKR